MPPPSKQGAFAAKVEQTLGIIPGTKIWSPFPFAGLNLQDTEPAIDDKEFSYIENFFHLGNGYMRTARDVDDPFWTVGPFNVIESFFWYNIADVDYLAVFLKNGTAVQINQTTLAETIIGRNLFWQPGGYLPACVAWGTKYLVIANRNTFNDYWIWDGATLFSAGGCGPDINITDGGANYGTLPTITAYGGTGSGIVITPTILNGSINTLVVNNPGQNYVPGDTVQLQFSGGGSDTGAILLAQIGSGSVASVSVTAGGSGYVAPTVTFSAPTGTTATATATLGGLFGQQVVHINVTGHGSGYVTAPSVTITGGGGTGAVAHATISDGRVIQITVTNGGAAYTSAPTVTLSAPTGGLVATGTASQTAGVVDNITVIYGGTGYTSAPSVTISDGSGTGATAVAFLSAGGVVAVDVADGGTNYTFPPPLSFLGGNGTGAAAVAKLVATSVASIAVTSGGGTPGIGGYLLVPDVIVHNAGTSGTGCTATAILGNGQVIGVTVTNGGSGYTYPPFITFANGNLPTGAAHATAEATLVGTPISSVIMSNQGHGYTQAPAVVILPGSNNAASAILEMMPFGVSGNALETFDSRVWVSYPFQNTSIPTGGDFLATTPGSLTDFATSDGGILFVNSDRFLRKQYTGMRQSNGYLYLFGDSSTSVVSNVNVGGVPATTTFSYQNVDPQIGMTWRDSVQDFGRTVIFANETGIYGLYGGAATKISGKLDTLFASAIYPPALRALTPSSAVAVIHNVKHYFLLFTVKDPETGDVRNVMATWNEKDWTLTSQTVDLQLIGTQEVNGDLIAWGTDGTTINQLFVKTSTTLVKRLTTKMYGTDSLFILKDFLNIYIQAQSRTPHVGVDMSVNMIANGIAVQPDGIANIDNDSVASGQFNSTNYPAVLFQQPSYNAPTPYYPVFGTGTGGFSFSTMALQLSTTSPDFVLSNLVIAYLDNTAYQ